MGLNTTISVSVIVYIWNITRAHLITKGDHSNGQVTPDLLLDVTKGGHSAEDPVVRVLRSLHEHRGDEGQIGTVGFLVHRALVELGVLQPRPGKLKDNGGTWHNNSRVSSATGI